METLSSIVPIVEKGMWATSLDAYLHIPIKQEDQKFLAFNYTGGELPVCFPTIWHIHGTNGLHQGKPDPYWRFYDNDNWLIVSRSEEDSKRDTDFHFPS